MYQEQNVENVSPFLQIILPDSKVAPFRYGKKLKISQIIRSLAMLGPSTTYQMGHHVRNVYEGSDYSDKEFKTTQYYASRYSKLLTGRNDHYLDSAEKVFPDHYKGLVKDGYVVKTGKISGEKKEVEQYFLTFKGILLSMCFNYGEKELSNVVQNISQYSIYFKFIEKIMNETSIALVRSIFIEPLRSVLKHSDIFLGQDMRFYFTNIAEYTSHELTNKMQQIEKRRIEELLDKPIEYYGSLITLEDREKFPKASLTDLALSKMHEEELNIEKMIEGFQKGGIETIIDNLYYYEKPYPDWFELLIERFYKTKKARDTYRRFCYEYELDLIWKVMQGLHFTYYHNIQKTAPRAPRKKLPRSKVWKKLREKKERLTNIPDGKMTSRELFEWQQKHSGKQG